MMHLYLINLIAWFFPVLLFKGINKIIIFLIAYIFSQSYWIYPLLMDVFEIDHFSVVILSHIEKVVMYSILAGISFNFAILFVVRKFVFVKPKLRFRYKISLRHFFTTIFAVRVIVFYLIFYCFIMAMTEIGASDRGEFLAKKLFWYSILIPLTIFLLNIIQIYDYNRFIYKFDFLHYVTLFQVLLVLILLGFDGSRREAVFLLLPMFVFILKNYFNHTSASMNNALIFYALIFLLVSSVLSLNRAGDVGWNYIFDVDLITLLKGVVYIISPMSTLHVNTQMLEYTDINGYQGVTNYFSAIGNFLFPNFIFGKYLFGEPLVLKIHDELGWVGMDFGFMAEAIYSGGIYAVLFMHLIYGLLVGYFLKQSSKNKLTSLIFIFFIIFGMVNSLRSDFMNLLKTTFYLPLFASVVVYFFKKKF